MENSTRILLGNKPGKKKKKRKYEKDLAIWNPEIQGSVAKKTSRKSTAKKLPESIDGHKLILPKTKFILPNTGDKGQKLTNALIK